MENTRIIHVVHSLCTLKVHYEDFIMLTETKSIASYDYLDSMEAWEEKLVFERWNNQDSDHKISNVVPEKDRNLFISG